MAIIKFSSALISIAPVGVGYVLGELRTQLFIHISVVAHSNRMLKTGLIFESVSATFDVKHNSAKRFMLILMVW